MSDELDLNNIVWELNKEYFNEYFSNNGIYFCYCDTGWSEAVEFMNHVIWCSEMDCAWDDDDNLIDVKAKIIQRVKKLALNINEVFSGE